MWCQQNTVVVEKLNRPPFSIRVTQHELEVKLGPEALLKILNDVLSEIDPTMATDGDSTAKTLGLLKVLQLGVPRGAAKDLEAKLRAGDKATVFALLHWALARLGSHKKRVYDARFELSIEALAAASAPAPEHNALWAHFAQLEANLRRFDNASPANASPAANAPPSPVPPLPTPSRSPLKSSRVSPPPPPYAAARGAALFRSMDASADVSVASSDGTYADELAAERPWRRSEAKVPESVVMNHLEDDLDDTDDEAAAVHPIFDKVLEVGIPAAWDLHRLLQLAAVDSVETSANPRRTLAQRWKASLKSVASKVTSTLRKKESARAAAQAKDDADLCSECLHATEPGAVNPQLVWSYPRGGSDALALEVATFCFPEGAQLFKAKDAFAFIFNLSVPQETPSSKKAQGAVASSASASSNLLHGVCWVETRARRVGDAVVNVPTCYCILTRWPFFELHLHVLRGAVLLAEKAASAVTGVASAALEGRADSERRRAFRDVLARYGAVKPPKRGCQADFFDDGLTWTRPVKEECFAFLERANDAFKLPPLHPSMRWTRTEFEAIDGAAAWAVPIALALLPPAMLLRALAASLCELQVVVLASRPREASACVLALAALLRPLLWVGPLIPILPTHLHALLEAPVPFIIGAPRTETWSKCLEARLPKPGLVVLDVDLTHLFVHPHDADLVELPHAEELEEALEPMLSAFAEAAQAPSKNGQVFVDERLRRACASVLRVVSRHVVKLATIATRFESKAPGNDLRRSRLAQSLRTRDSIEFAQLFKGSTDDAGPSVEASRDVIRSSFAAGGRASTMWARQSTDLKLRNSIADDPLRRRFFERLAEAQSYDIYRACFPRFKGFDDADRTLARKADARKARLSAGTALSPVDERSPPSRALPARADPARSDAAMDAARASAGLCGPRRQIRRRRFRQIRRRRPAPRHRGLAARVAAV